MHHRQHLYLGRRLSDVNVVSFCCCYRLLLSPATCLCGHKTFTCLGPKRGGVNMAGYLTQVYYLYNLSMQPVVIPRPRYLRCWLWRVVQPNRHLIPRSFRVLQILWAMPVKMLQWKYVRTLEASPVLCHNRCKLKRSFVTKEPWASWMILEWWRETSMLRQSVT